MKNNLCWTCLDDINFRMHGQTPGYDNNILVIKFLEKLKDGDVIDCKNCGSKKVYNQLENGKWKEDYN